MAFVSKLVKRGFASSSSVNAKIQEVVIIGGGLMGAGIAQVAAQTGHTVTVVDTSQELLDRSNARISDSIKRVAKKKFKDDEALIIGHEPGKGKHTGRLGALLCRLRSL